MIAAATTLNGRHQAHQQHVAGRRGCRFHPWTVAGNVLGCVARKRRARDVPAPNCGDPRTKPATVNVGALSKDCSKPVGCRFCTWQVAGFVRGSHHKKDWQPGCQRRNDETRVQKRQPIADKGCRFCTRSVDAFVPGRLPEMYLYTNEELQVLNYKTLNYNHHNTAGNSTNREKAGAGVVVGFSIQTLESSERLKVGNPVANFEPDFLCAVDKIFNRHCYGAAAQEPNSMRGECPK